MSEDDKHVSVDHVKELSGAGSAECRICAHSAMDSKESRGSSSDKGNL